MFTTDDARVKLNAHKTGRWRRGRPIGSSFRPIDRSIGSEPRSSDGRTDGRRDANENEFERETLSFVAFSRRFVRRARAESPEKKEPETRSRAADCFDGLIRSIGRVVVRPVVRAVVHHPRGCARMNEILVQKTASSLASRR